MKFFAILALGMFGTSAFAQTCYVDLVQKPYNRVIRSFVAYGDSSCMAGMRECRKAIRFDYSNNPQYPNNSLDCVGANRQPTPQPNPYPTPNPYPNPTPNPYPDYGSIDLKMFSVELAQYIVSNQNKFSFYQIMARHLNNLQLTRLVDTCNSATTYQQTVYCIEDGMRYMPMLRLDTYAAKNIALDGCVKTQTYSEEARCLEAAARYFPTLSTYTRSCLVSGYGSNAANCLKNIIRNYL